MSNTTKSSDALLNELRSQGYLRTSNNFCMVARIDREDWKEVMAKSHSPWDIEEGLKWVDALGKTGAEDYYRRCCSKDKKVVPREIFKQLKSSGDKATGFIKIAKKNLKIGKL